MLCLWSNHVLSVANIGPSQSEVLDVIKHFFYSQPSEGRHSHQELVQETAHCPPIDGLRVLLLLRPVDHLWGHVVWSADHFLRVLESGFLELSLLVQSKGLSVDVEREERVFVELETQIFRFEAFFESGFFIHLFVELGEAEVGESEMGLFSEQNVLWLQIAMNNFLRMQFFHGQNQRGNVVLGCVVLQTTILLQYSPHVSSYHVVHHDTKVVLVHEGEVSLG